MSTSGNDPCEMGVIASDAMRAVDEGRRRRFGLRVNSDSVLTEGLRFLAALALTVFLEAGLAFDIDRFRARRACTPLARGFGFGARARAGLEGAADGSIFKSSWIL
jgi:hypothetical protein